MITRSARIALGGLAFATVVLASREAAAAGTAVDVQSGRATGMASASTAMVDDSSAIYFNPAGIANGRRLDAQVGAAFIMPAFKFENAQTGNKTTIPFYVVPPPHAYVSTAITEGLHAGVGVFSPYGLLVKWPENWEGRTISTRSQLETFYINPTLAYRIGPLRFGGGVQIVRGTVMLSRNIRFAPGLDEGSVTLGAGTWGVGGNGGVQLDLFERLLTLGIHYRSAVKLSFDGNAHFNNVPTAFSPIIHDQVVSTSLTQPDQLAMGVAVRPFEKMVFDLDVVWIGWAKLRNVELNFPEDQSGTLKQTLPKNWNNTANVHLGGEYSFDQNWQVRGGALFDPSPSPGDTLTPEIPDASRLNLAAGGSYRHDSGFRVDLGYQFIYLFSKTSTAPQLPGDYGGNVNLIGLTLGYQTPERHD